MIDIPIIIDAPDCQPLTDYDNETHSDGPEQTLPHALPPPSHIHPLSTLMVSEGTQTDSPDSPTGSNSPTHHHASPPFPKSPFTGWTEHLFNYYSGSHSNHRPPVGAAGTITPGSLLAPPRTDAPHRPMTPRADLYSGQTSANFGMTFGKPAPNWRGSSKPTGSANNYEDHKHRMTMNWLERRGTV